MKDRGCPKLLLVSQDLAIVRRRLVQAFLLLVGATWVCPQPVIAEPLPPQLEGVDIIPKLGQSLNLGLAFRDEEGKPIPLERLGRSGRPVLLNFVYYECPMLCNLVLNGQTAALRELSWTAGVEFDVITISIDPAETPELAARKKRLYLQQYGRQNTAWHFLTDYQGNVQRLAAQAGFGYRRDERTGQFAHAAAILVLTPDGRISRYLNGVKFRARDLRLALTEASEGKLGTVADKLLLFCFHYDSSSGSYALAARQVMRWGGALLAFGFCCVLVALFRWDVKRSRERRSVSALSATR